MSSYARRLDVSHQRVSYLKKHGKLKMTRADIDEKASYRSTGNDWRRYAPVHLDRSRISMTPRWRNLNMRKRRVC